MHFGNYLVDGNNFKGEDKCSVGVINVYSQEVIVMLSVILTTHLIVMSIKNRTPLPLPLASGGG